MNVPVHRNTDSRSCGASTTVSGQSNVYVNNLLASVQGDPNTHGGGALSASVNDGTVFINNKKVVLKGSSASPDALCPPKGPPHCNPKSVGASPNVFACNGSAGQGGTGGGSGVRDSNNPTSPSSTQAASTEDDPNAMNDDEIRDDYVDPAGEGGFDRSAFSESDLARINELERDPEWQRELEALEARYPGLDRTELYQIINGESNFDPQAQNRSGATGLFQLMPDSARELGYSTDQIGRMTPAQQLNVYGQYLDRWNYDTNNSLGIMQAAPAYAGRSGNEVIYPVGSAAWKQNPGWQSPGQGPITVDSINSYYRGTLT